MVLELPREDQEQGARFSGRLSALDAAMQEISGGRPIASEEYREGVLEEIGGLRGEISGAFKAWRSERGIPDVTEGA